ncbi:MAG: CotH kinase family protein [Bacteroidota bacterium]|nr:CotH kinase family protein [Bacteroidota bacterium]
MKLSYHILWAIFFLLLQSSCEKALLLSGTNALLEFKLEAVHNEGKLQEDIEATIEGKKILLAIPQFVKISNLVATFNHNGRDIYINFVPQNSTVTPNDFSKNLVYEVVAENGDIAKYLVQIEIIGETELIVSSFSFKKADNPHLSKDWVLERQENVYQSKANNNLKDLIATFETNASSVTVKGVAQESGKTVIDFSNPVTYTFVSSNGISQDYIIDIKWTTDIPISLTEIPHLFIVTEANASVNTKDYYLQGTLTIDGKGIYEDYNGTTGISGRGNTTWSKPKKPYRLKLDNKASLLGLEEEKDWVLLANYLDETLMLNAVAMKIGQQLDIPFTNNIIPVDLTINGKYSGNYMLTEQIEVSKTRIDIEDGGALLEMDIYFDDDFKFRSDFYDLPVMVKYPKLKDYAPQEATQEFNLIKNDFQILEDAVSSASFPSNNYLDFIDAEALVNYLIVYNFTYNFEINHPKSTYLYKPKDKKYMMGPIWDFDWAFSYNGSNSHFHSTTNTLFTNNPSFLGTKFFSRFMKDPKIKELYANKWAKYKSNHFPMLLDYIDDYAVLIKDSQKKDYEVWKVGSMDFEQDVQKLKSWLEARAQYIDSYVSGF